MFDSIKETLSSAYNSVKSTVSEAIDEVTEAAENAIDTVSDAVSSLGDNSVFQDNSSFTTQDVIEYVQEAETPDYQATVLEGDDEFASAEQSYVQAQNQNEGQEQSLVSNAINWVSDKVEETLGASVSDIATEIKNDVIEAADNFLFSKGEAAPVNEEAIQRETGEIQYVPAYTNDERLEKTDNEIRVVKIQEWNSSANSNDSLERIIENSYDLKALGIEYGSKEYIDLENKIMAMNPEIFAKDGINSILYDDDKIKLPVVGYKKVKNEKTETKEPSKTEDEIKKAAFEKELAAAIEKEERELKAQQQSGGGIDKIASFFGWESKEEKAIADKKAALEKAMKSDNIQDKIAAYKLINNLTNKSDEEISNLIEAQQKQSLDAIAAYGAMQSGVFEFGGKAVSMDEITSIVGEQIASNGRDVQNAYERQGWFSKGVGNINDYIGIGTTNDNIKAQYELQQQMLQELQNCKNPVEYAAKFKQITGQDFNTQSIMQLMAYKHAGEEIPSSEPKQGKIDLSMGVKEITDTLGDKDKENLSLTKDTKLSETIEEYKGTQEAVLDGAIAVGTGVLVAGLTVVGGPAGMAIGAGISTGVHIADSYYDSDGDGKSEFNYELKNLPVDLGLGGLNGLTGGIAGVGKAILVKTAGKQIGKKAVSTALRTLPQGVNAAEATAKETLKQTIKNSAAKVTTNLMAHALEDYANGAIYSAADYSLRTLTDENKEFNFGEALEHAHQGGEAGILFGGALRSGAKAVSSANKFFKKSKTDINEPAKSTKQEDKKAVVENQSEKEPIKPTKPDNENVIEETAPKNTQNVFQDVDAIFKKEDEILKQFADTGLSPKAEMKAAKELEEQLDNLYQKYKNLPDGAEKQKLAEMIKLRNEYHYADLGLYTNNSELKNKLDNILGEINAAEQKVKTASIKDKTDNNVTEIKEEVKSSEPQKTEPVDENVKSSETNKGDEVLDTEKSVKERAGQAYKSAKDTVLDAKKTVQEKANQVYEGVKDTAASAKDKVSGAIKSAKEKAGQVYDKAQSAAASVKEKAGNLADSAGGKAKNFAERIINKLFTKTEASSFNRFQDLRSAKPGSVIPDNMVVQLNSNTKITLPNNMEVDLSKLPDGHHLINRFDGKIHQMNEQHAILLEPFIMVTKKGDSVNVTHYSKKNDIKISSTNNNTGNVNSGNNLQGIKPAKQIENPYELCRNVGNDGKSVNIRYIQNSNDARSHINSAIDNGNYTRSYQDYVNTMNNAHKLAYSGKSGNNLYYKKNKQIYIMNAGEWRGQGQLQNGYKDEALLVENIAIKYNDSYRMANSETLRLRGIDDTYLPYNIKHRHIYPDGDGLTMYHQQMYRTAKEAVEMIKRGATQDEFLGKLAEHYQYAANARTYEQINNSLYMLEINTLLQRAGMKTMPHGMLDHAAQRLQPETFKKYFIDEYKKTALNANIQAQSPIFKNMRNVQNNTPLNKGEAVIVNDDAKLNLAGQFEIDLTHPKIANLKEGEFVNIGRKVNRPNDIQVPSSYTRVSRQHLQIVRHKGELVVKDLSTNGTTISYAGK